MLRFLVACCQLSDFAQTYGFELRSSTRAAPEFLRLLHELLRAVPKFFGGSSPELPRALPERNVHNYSSAGSPVVVFHALNHKGPVEALDPDFGGSSCLRKSKSRWWRYKLKIHPYTSTPQLPFKSPQIPSNRDHIRP